MNTHRIDALVSGSLAGFAFDAGSAPLDLGHGSFDLRATRSSDILLVDSDELETETVAIRFALPLAA